MKRLNQRRSKIKLIVICVMILALFTGGYYIYQTTFNPEPRAADKIDQDTENSISYNLSDEHSEIDSSYASIRIIYHQQAIELSDIALERSSNPEIKEFATRLKVNEAKNANRYIALLSDWGEEVLNLWDFPEVDGCHGYPQQDGMASLSDIRQLKNLTGQEFDEKFISLIQVHHEKSKNLIKGQIITNKKLYESDKQSINFHLGEIDSIKKLL